MSQQSTLSSSSLRRRWVLGAGAVALLVAALLWPRSRPSTEKPDETAPSLRPAAKSPPAPAAQSSQGAGHALPTRLPPLPAIYDLQAASAPLPVARYFELETETACRCKAGRVAADRFASELIACRALFHGASPVINEAVMQGVAAGRVAYDPAAAQRCIRDGATCGESRPIEDARPCGEVFRGLVPAGGVCADTVDCAAGHCAKDAISDPTGVCAARLAVGSPCKSMVDCMPSEPLGLQCIDGTCQPAPAKAGDRCEFTCKTAALWCDTDAKPPVCRATHAQDATCNPDKPRQCREDLACRDGRSGFHCAPPSQQGEGCDPEKPYDECAGGLRCVAHPRGGRCLPTVGFGEPCAADGQCHYEAICAGSNANQAGHCEDLPVASEACAERLVNGRRCRSPFVCDLARRCCVVALAEGDPCEGYLCSGMPFTITCVHGVCRARQPLGAPCEDESKAASGEGELRCASKLECVDGRCTKP